MEGARGAQSERLVLVVSRTIQGEPDTRWPCAMVVICRQGDDKLSHGPVNPSYSPRHTENRHLSQRRVKGTGPRPSRDAIPA
jgi:hypothetical protein